MERARVKDMLLGATGVVLVQVLAAAIVWWAVTDPVDEGAGPGSAPTVDPWRPPLTGPPPDLGEDEAWFAELRLDSDTVVAAGSTLHDVTAIGHDVVTTSEEVVASRVTVEATVPFAVVSEELGDGVEVREAPDGQAMVIRTVEALDREVDVTATGTVEVEDGRLVVEPSSIDLGGPDVLSEAVADVVRRLVTIDYDVAGPPEGLVLQEVAVQGAGFRATLRGADVRLVP